MSEFDYICKYQTLREAKKYMKYKEITFKEIRSACSYEKRSIIEFLYSNNPDLIFTVLVQSIATFKPKLFKYYFNKHVHMLDEEQIKHIFVLAIEGFGDPKITISMAKKYKIDINKIKDIDISVSMICDRDCISELCKKIKYKPNLSQVLKSSIIGCNYELAMDLIDEGITIEIDDEFNKVLKDGIDLNKEYLNRAIKN